MAVCCGMLKYKNRMVDVKKVKVKKDARINIGFARLVKPRGRG